MIDSYGNKVTNIAIDFHRDRRMFAVVGCHLQIADSDNIDSHMDWFLDQKWIIYPGDDYFKYIVRGFVDKNGNVRFYVGMDFEITTNAEHIFFKFLPELVKRLNLSLNGIVTGGAIKQDKEIVYAPRKVYGTIGECLSILNV